MHRRIICRSSDRRSLEDFGTEGSNIGESFSSSESESESMRSGISSTGSTGGVLTGGSTGDTEGAVITSLSCFVFFLASHLRFRLYFLRFFLWVLSHFLTESLMDLLPGLGSAAAAVWSDQLISTVSVSSSGAVLSG